MPLHSKIADPMSWSQEEISALWEEMDSLRLKAREEGWEEEFLSNVNEWIESNDKFPIGWLKLRREQWKY